MEIRVVEADLDDPCHQSAVVDLLDGYARDPMGGGKPLPVAARERLITGLRAHPTSLVFLAFADATAVGVAVCFRGFSTFTALPLLNIHDLAVTSGFRRRGVARRLLECVEARARALGCGKLTLEVREDNRVAQDLYSSFGFNGGQHLSRGRVQVWWLEKSVTPEGGAS